MALIKLNNQSISAVTALPSGVGGKILQIQSTLYDTATTQSLTGQTDTAVSNLNVTITPSSTSSKILLLGRLFFENSYTYNDVVLFFLRGSTKINSGQTAGSRTTGIASNSINAQDSASTPDTVSLYTLDSPNSSSAITYHIGINSYGSGTLHINSTISTTDGANYERGSSEIIAMEVGA